RLSTARARRALAACGIDTVEVEPLGGLDDRRSARFAAVTATGERLFVKLIPRERRDGDLLYRALRRLLRGLTRPGPGAGPPREQVEREAYLALLAWRAGVRTPAVVFAGPCDNDAGLLVQRWIPGRALDQRRPEEVGDDLLRAVWREVARLREARIAHGDLGRASIVVDEQETPWLVDFDRAEAVASEALLAADVAELLASLAVWLGPERAVACATEVLGAAAVAGALHSGRSVVLTRATRTELRGRPGLWEALLAKAG
ncbi:MAG TPA: lipopolysaccharide kinase InaA family protein, partial [Actinomycetota bacterium]|nr:lipopolysaccharide kinase InaA family protein [Actinomycetota bacterium]